MFSIHDRVSRAAQAQIESQLDTGATLADQAMYSMQQVTALNLNLARATLEQSNFAMRQVMSAQDADELLALAAAQIQPNARRTLDYGYYLVTITAGAQTGLIETVGARIADASRRLLALAADVERYAPAGVGAALQLLDPMADGINPRCGDARDAAQK